MRWGSLETSRAARWSFVGAAPGQRARIAIAFLTVAAYVAFFVPAYAHLGLAIAAVATVPVSVIAYLWGMRAGILAGVVASPVHIALLGPVLGEPLDVAIRGSTGPGSLMLLGVGLIVGRMADLGRRIREQQETLLAEREALREWQGRYSELITTLAAGNDVPEPGAQHLLEAADSADVAYFRRFLGLLVPVAALFGAVELGGGLALSLPAYAVMGAVTLAFSALAFGARVALARGATPSVLAAGLGVGMVLVALAAVTLAPAQSPELTLVPILAASLSLRFLTGRALRQLLVFCWAGSVAVAITGEVLAPAALLANPFDALIRLAAVPAVAGLVFYLLAAHNARQRSTLELLDRHYRDAQLAEARYRGLFDGLPIGLYRTTPSGRFLDANPAMVQMLGFPSRVDLLAASVPAVYVNEADRDEWCAEIERSGMVLAAELEMRRPDGTRLWIRDTAHLVRGPGGEALYFEGAAEDITEAKRLESQLRHQAFHDPLTGLANRRLLLERLQEAIARSRHNGVRPAVLFVDLDDFKLINDSLGHDVGDRVLRTLATRLVGNVGPNDTVARLAGDEFTVLVESTTEGAAAAALAERLLARLSEPIAFTEREVTVGVSIGVALASGYAEEALGQADIAMYAAKRSGKGRVAMYDPAMHEEAWRRLEIEAQVRGAADRGELVVHYQPILDLEGDTLRRVEALVRWEHPTLGLLPPGAFIDAAERAGHVGRIGRFVLAEACRTVVAWRSELGLPDLATSVNVSAVEIRDGSVTEAVRDALGAAGLEPGALSIEITETSLLADSAAIDRVLGDLREIGVRLAIDDFGAGFSNLGYLKRLPVDELKIDRSLVAGIAAGSRDEAVLNAAVAFGRTLGHRVTVEGVETEQQLDAVRRAGADAVQGYVISPPLPADEIVAVLGRTRSAVSLRGGR